MRFLFLNLTALVFISILSCTKKGDEKTASEKAPELVSAKTDIETEDEKMPKGCPEDYQGARYGKNQFGMVHQFLDGSELWLCGSGTLDKFTGTAYLKRKDVDIVDTIETFGGAAELWDVLSMSWVAINLKDQSFEAAKLIPYRDYTQINSVNTVYNCSTRGCEAKKKATCVLKVPHNKPTGEAHSKIKSFLSSKKISLEPKDFDKVSENVPSDQDFFELYLDALDGHGKSISFLLQNTNLPSKIKNAYKYETPEATFKTLRDFISVLTKNSCLKISE